MRNKKIPKYAYSEQLLIDRIKDCDTIEELVETCDFYNEMQSENLILITYRIKIETQKQQLKIIYNNPKI